jgi:threonine dehydratase
MVFALKGHRLVVEGGGAVGIAALLHGKVKEVGRNVVVVVSGGNVDTPVLLEITQTHGSSDPVV